MKTYLSFVGRGHFIAGSSVFESPRLRVLDVAAGTGERRIQPLRLADVLAWVFLGIGDVGDGR